MSVTRWIGLSVLLSGPLVFGCGSNTGGAGGQPVAPQAATLQDVADLLRVADAEHSPATKAADLARFERVSPNGYQAVKSGDVVVIWGGKMAGEGEAETAPKGVIAYEKNAPAAGGYVLLQNGTIQQMTAEGFKAAPKAK